MNQENGKLEGDCDINGDFQLNGMITGSATVKRGVFFHLNGMVTESLIIEEGAEVVLNGTVSQDVINKGGNLAVFGMISGDLHHQKGSTEIDDNAEIVGEVRGLD